MRKKVKGKDRLHIQESIGKEIITLFYDFYERRALSYDSFIRIWSNRELSDLHHFPLDKINYGNYLQLWYNELFIMFCDDNHWAVLGTKIDCKDKSPSLDLIDNHEIKMLFSHCFLVYFLYTIYMTQLPLSPQSSSQSSSSSCSINFEEFIPVRVERKFYLHLKFLRSLLQAIIKSASSSSSSSSLLTRPIPSITMKCLSKYQCFADCHMILEFLFQHENNVFIRATTIGPIGYSFIQHHSSQGSSSIMESVLTAWENNILQLLNLSNSFVQLSSLAFAFSRPVSEIDQAIHLLEEVFPLSINGETVQTIFDDPELVAEQSESSTLAFSSAETIEERRRMYFDRLQARNQESELKNQKLLLKMQKLKDKIYQNSGRMTSQTPVQQSQFSSPKMSDDIENILNGLTNLASTGVDQTSRMNKKHLPSKSTNQKISRKRKIAEENTQIASYIQDEGELDSFISAMMSTNQILEDTANEELNDQRYNDAENLLSQLNEAIDDVLSDQPIASSNTGNHEVSTTALSNDLMESDTETRNNDEPSKLEALMNELNKVVCSILDERNVSINVSLAKQNAHNGNGTINTKRRQAVTTQANNNRKKTTEKKMKRMTSADLSSPHDQPDIKIILSQLESASSQILSSQEEIS